MPSHPNLQHRYRLRLLLSHFRSMFHDLSNPPHSHPQDMAQSMLYPQTGPCSRSGSCLAELGHLSHM